MSAGDLARIRAMRRWIDDATATRVIPWRFGTAVFTDDFPGRYDSNFLRVERPLDGLAAADLAAEADAVQAALGHRELQMDDTTEGARLAPGFAELGYECDRLLWMVQRTPADAGPVPVREVDATTLQPTLVASNRSFPGMSDGDAEMLAAFRRVSQERAGTRFFAAELDGKIAGYCELYLHDDVAQVEDVNTLERFRRRGAGGSLVRAASAAAREAGADLVWLLADAEDWPKGLYGALGFEAIGTSWQFTRAPAAHAARLRDPGTSGA